MAPEEAVRGYTVWSAFAGFDEQDAGTIAVGRRADITVISVDPFRDDPRTLLGGRVVMTMSRGRITSHP